MRWTHTGETLTVTAAPHTTERKRKKKMEIKLQATICEFKLFQNSLLRNTSCDFFDD